MFLDSGSILDVFSFCSSISIKAFFVVAQPFRLLVFTIQSCVSSASPFSQQSICKTHIDHLIMKTLITQKYNRNSNVFDISKFTTENPKNTKITTLLPSLLERIFVQIWDAPVSQVAVAHQIQINMMMIIHVMNSFQKKKITFSSYSTNNESNGINHYLFHTHHIF